MAWTTYNFSPYNSVVLPAAMAGTNYMVWKDNNGSVDGVARGDVTTGVSTFYAMPGTSPIISGAFFFKGNYYIISADSGDSYYSIYRWNNGSADFTLMNNTAIATGQGIGGIWMNSTYVVLGRRFTTNGIWYTTDCSTWTQGTISVNSNNFMGTGLQNVIIDPEYSGVLMGTVDQRATPPSAADYHGCRFTGTSLVDEADARSSTYHAAMASRNEMWFNDIVTSYDNRYANNPTGAGPYTKIAPINPPGFTPSGSSYIYPVNSYTHGMEMVGRDVGSSPYDIYQLNQRREWIGWGSLPAAASSPDYALKVGSSFIIVDNGGQTYKETVGLTSWTLRRSLDSAMAGAVVVYTGDAQAYIDLNMPNGTYYWQVEKVGCYSELKSDFDSGWGNYGGALTANTTRITSDGYNANGCLEMRPTGSVSAIFDRLTYGAGPAVVPFYGLLKFAYRILDVDALSGAGKCLSVEIRDSSASPIEVFSLSFSDITVSDTGWVPVHLDLSDYVGESIYNVVFQAATSSGAGGTAYYTRIDDICLGA